MSISRQTSTLLDTIKDEPIPESTREFFRHTLRNRYHSLILRAFKEAGITQKTIADRLAKEPAQINRLLATSGNWTLNTLSDLMLALGVDLNDPSYTSISELIADVPADSIIPTDSLEPKTPSQDELKNLPESPFKPREQKKPRIDHQPESNRPPDSWNGAEAA